MQLGISASLGATATSGVESATLITNTKSILFDGTDNYINLKSDFKSITQGGIRTVCAWVKAASTDPTSENDRGRIFTIYKGDDNSSFAIHAEGSSAPANWRYMYRSTGSPDTFNSVDSGVNVTTSWTHLALTQNGANLKFYINGEEEDSKTDATYLWSATRPAIIGGHSTSAGEYQEFNGNIDEVGLWNSELSATEIKAIYENIRLDFTKDSVGYVSSSNLAGWWRMGDEADTRVADNNANNLIVPDTRKTFFTGKSIDFDGSDDYIACGEGGGELDFTSAMTVSFWVKADAQGGTGSENVLLSKYKFANGYRSYGVFTGLSGSTGKLRFIVSQDGEYSGGETMDYQTNGVVLDGTWHHYAATFNAGTILLYLDGSADSIGTKNKDDSISAILAEDINFLIGATHNSSGVVSNHFDGSMADVAVWNAVLDANTIASIYNSGEPNDLTLAASYTAGSGVDKTSNLQGYWRMGNASNYSFPFIPSKNLSPLGDNLLTGDDSTFTGGIGNWSTSTWAHGDEATFDYTTNSGKGTLSHASGNNNATVSYTLTTEAGRDYQVSFDYIQSYGQLYVRVGTSAGGVQDKGSTTINTNNSNWEANNETITFTFTASTDTSYIAFHHFDAGSFGGSGQSASQFDNFTIKEITNNAGVMTNMSQYDIVEHAPNRHSGDMIGFDATSDIEDDVKT